MKAYSCIFIVLLLMISACGNKCPDGYNNTSYNTNPYRNAFIGNYHVVDTNYSTTGSVSRFDMTVSNAGNGNWINISNFGTFSTSDSTCWLNNDCETHSTSGTSGVLKGNTLILTSSGPDAQPPRYISNVAVGIKY